MLQINACFFTGRREETENSARRLAASVTSGAPGSESPLGELSSLNLLVFFFGGGGRGGGAFAFASTNHLQETGFLIQVYSNSPRPFRSPFSFTTATPRFRST